MSDDWPESWIRPVVVISAGTTTPTPVSRGEVVLATSDAWQIATAKDAWARLHSMQDWTPATIAQWLATVPSISCDCRRFATDYVRDNPPPYGNLAGCQRWSYDFHCAVDRKVGDAIMPYQETAAIWGWL